MKTRNYVAILVAAVAAFVAAAVYYIVFGDAYAEVSVAAREAAKNGPQPWEIPVELVRNLIVAVVLAWLAATTSAHTWARAAVLALTLRIGFPFVLWTGAIAHENTPLQLAGIHGGDWLLKLMVISLVFGLWPRRRSHQPARGNKLDRDRAGHVSCVKESAGFPPLLRLRRSSPVSSKGPHLLRPPRRTTRGRRHGGPAPRRTRHRRRRHFRPVGQWRRGSSRVDEPVEQAVPGQSNFAEHLSLDWPPNT